MPGVGADHHPAFGGTRAQGARRALRAPVPEGTPVRGGQAVLLPAEPAQGVPRLSVGGDCGQKQGHPKTACC